MNDQPLHGQVTDIVFMNDNAKPLDHNLYVVQLTSLRGVACMVVLIGHVVQVVNYHHASAGKFLDGVRNLIAGTFNAEGAVLVFFVLSGCVLSLSLRNITQFNRPVVFGFYVKRIFRLYPLLWLSLIIAVFSMLAAENLARQEIFAGWLTKNILSGISMQHSLYSITGFYTSYNGPIWSLRVELIYSALFPAIYLGVKNPRRRATTLIGLTIVTLLPIEHRFGTAFALSFAAGALIPMLPYRPSRFDISLLLAAVPILIYDRLTLGSLVPERVFDLLETCAAFVIVRDILTAPQRYRFLLSPALVTLGETSFSIYLLHLPIFLILFTLVSHGIGVQALLDHPAATQIAMSVLTAAVTIVMSFFTYRLVELPMHNIGRRLGKQVSGKPAPVTAPLHGRAEPPFA